MVKQKKEVAEVNTEQKSMPDRAVLFELENFAVKGRQIVSDLLKKILSEKDIELTLNMFSRYCSHPSVKHFLPMMLKMEGKAKVSEAKLMSEITEAITRAFTDSSLKLESGVPRLLKAMEEERVVVATLSSLDDETARQLSAKLGLIDRGITLLSYASQEKNFPSADAWLKLAKKISIIPACCVVIATSSVSCKAALSAGMRCVVVPDKFTAFQDFGGADNVFDDFGDEAIKHIIELLKAS
ncbi:MAG: HAD hydrolase-like protein [Kiritimatiellae bacterium]|nr:HAD hydrolase-like protein [Kiritimatiellia bacterium]MDD5520009.1 HAD hydrolase-like protein [Kiritimatiellia bacterium]